MKNIWFLLVFLSYFSLSTAQTTISIMDSIIFHDGYAGLVTSPSPPVGIIKHRNDLFARKMTSAELSSIGDSLQMNVVIKALCDNYDRIGNVNMALVPVGSSTYNPDSVQHIELGRFITPFMNKNFQPDSVSYLFNIDNISLILKDTVITNSFDIWIELSVFGVPYAANNEVAGCSNRNDVFFGKLQFLTNAAVPSQNTNTLIPLFFKNAFNNYQVGATDTIGNTTKTISFDVPVNLTDASFYLITSNHGANQGGEEYNRRFHYAFYDNELKLTYKPGRLTCEPFRIFNTQGNGIYGNNPRTPSQWQSFSNWCPGDVIDIRKIEIGEINAGNHTFLINVPTAVFSGGQGDIPLSLYLQGKSLPIVGIKDYSQNNISFSVYPNPTSGQFTVELGIDNAEITVTNMIGKQIVKIHSTEKVNNLQLNDNGFYIINVTTKQGTTTRKLIVNR